MIKLSLNSKAKKFESFEIEITSLVQNQEHRFRANFFSEKDREILEENGYEPEPDSKNIYLGIGEFLDNFYRLVDTDPPEEKKDVSREYVSFINIMIQMYGEEKGFISWGGKECKISFACQGHTSQDVVVYEAGIRGPADWYYFDSKSGKIAHGGYTAYEEQYNFKEFEQLLKDMFEHNKTHLSEK